MRGREFLRRETAQVESSFRAALPSFAIVDTTGEHHNKRAREVFAGMAAGEIKVLSKQVKQRLKSGNLPGHGASTVRRQIFSALSTFSCVGGIAKLGDHNHHLRTRFHARLSRSKTLARYPDQPPRRASSFGVSPRPS